MDTALMVHQAGYIGFVEPMYQLDSETLKVHDPKSNDVAFLRFVEGHIYVYQYSYEGDPRPKVY